MIDTMLQKSSWRNSSLEEVIHHLEIHKNETDWAKLTSEIAVDNARRADHINHGRWYTGLLPKELFSQIILPRHEHTWDIGNDFIFPDNTTVAQALHYYKNNDTEPMRACMKAIDDLKRKIKLEGFTTTIVLAILDNKLIHLDGLHRLLAMQALLDEGQTYIPIPVFLSGTTIE